MPAVAAAYGDPLAAALGRELGLLVGRLRGYPAGALAAAAGPFGSRAEAAHHLAGRVAAGTRALGAGPPEGTVLPRLADLAAADQLAVLAGELDAALRTARPPREPAAAAPEDLAAGLLAEVLLHRSDVDGAAPGPVASALVLAVLAPGEDGGARAVLALARARCPAYRSGG